MKYLIILGDGMADRPIAKLGGKTPLEAANKPNIDELASLGRSGLIKTIPDDMPTGSAVANLSVLGYDPHKYFSGRGVLEAANIGVEVDKSDLVLRLNLINVENSKIKNHSAGHISTEEAKELIATLNEKLGSDRVSFYSGISYKHILVIKHGNKDIECAPPHDHPDEQFLTLLTKPITPAAEETSNLINCLILKSKEILKSHIINKKREAAGTDPANLIWPWSPGKKPEMPSFKELHGLKGAVISAVDLIKGIGVYAGMDIIEVPGATGLFDTNYEGKAKAAIETLKTHDFLYLHIEASDEAGHEGDVDLKVKTIEYLDSRVVKYIKDNMDLVGEELTIAVLPDHATPAEMRIHTREAVPFIVVKPGIEGDDVSIYDEKSATLGSYKTLEAQDFIKSMI
jgi:2,3-bisphosphoglycerate-independent phosphoglycerate mutase